MNLLKGFLIVGVLFLAGCAALNRIAPAQYDEQGQEVPFSREPTEFTKAVAGTVPYGDLVLASILFGAGVWQKYKRTKVEKGLKATLLAGKVVAQDPETREAWEKIKEIYREEHDKAGVNPIIKVMLAKLPTILPKKVG